ncbi:YnbE family lipoprotein [Methylococcus mesophilus]|nr:YnbE family lipoprotein [Methylococcus mesophilus]UZR30973.1 YnbE family lipoprotein [Methylococcus mesophilus]
MRGFLVCSVPLGSMLLLVACTPRVELAASKEPITINLNVKIDHEIRIKVEKDLEGVLSKESGLF